MASEHAEPKQKQSLMDKAKEFVADKIAHIPKPEATLDGVSFKSMSRECITLHSNVNVSNPYDHRPPHLRGHLHPQVRRQVRPPTLFYSFFLLCSAPSIPDR